MPDRKDAPEADVMAFTEALDRSQGRPKSERWRSRERSSTVQMSVRMDEDAYDAFRDMAYKRRMTNGEMMMELMRGYLAFHDDMGRPKER